MATAKAMSSPTKIFSLSDGTPVRPKEGWYLVIERRTGCFFITTQENEPVYIYSGGRADNKHYNNAFRGNDVAGSQFDFLALTANLLGFKCKGVKNDAEYIAVQLLRWGKEKKTASSKHP